MSQKPRTSDAHGRLWGARAQDWADFQEGTVRPVFEAVLERTRVGRGTQYLDAGGGSGMVLEMAAARGAEVSGVDAAEAMLSIARSRAPKGDLRQGDLEALPFADLAQVRNGRPTRTGRNLRCRQPLDLREQDRGDAWAHVDG